MTCVCWPVIVFAIFFFIWLILIIFAIRDFGAIIFHIIVWVILAIVFAYLIHIVCAAGYQAVAWFAVLLPFALFLLALFCIGLGIWTAPSYKHAFGPYMGGIIEDMRGEGAGGWRWTGSPVRT